MNKKYGWWFNPKIEAQELYYDLKDFNEELQYPVTNNIRKKIKGLESDFIFSEFKKYINGDISHVSFNIVKNIHLIRDKKENTICSYDENIFSHNKELQNSDIKNIIFFYTGYIDRISLLSNLKIDINVYFVKINPCVDFKDAIHSSDADFLINVCASSEEINLQFNLEKDSQIIVMYNNKFHSRLLSIWSIIHNRTYANNFYKIIEKEKYKDEIFSIFLDYLESKKDINSEAFIFCHKTSNYKYYDKEESINFSQHYGKNSAFLKDLNSLLNKAKFIQKCKVN